MSNRSLWLMGMVSALTVPYLTLDGNVPVWLQNTRQSMFGSQSAQPNAADMFAQSANAPGDLYAATYAAGAVTGDSSTPIVPLEDALRADVTPAAVLSRWPQVVTITSESHLAGLRVPLITGFAPHDLVGSLTYYFDQRQELRRISIQGTTSDENVLVAIVTRQFGLQPEPTLQGGLFLHRWKRQPLSLLRVELSPLLVAGSQQPSRSILMEINRPATGAHLSDESRAYLEQLGAAGS